MQITCADCKSVYNLTADQVRGLSFSILPCATCSKFIKISTCPYCNSYYAITFSSTSQNNYQLTCEKCAKPFIIEFPLIKEAKNAREIQSGETAPKRKFEFFKNLFGKNDRHISGYDGLQQKAPSAVSQAGGPSFSSTPVTITMGDVFALCGSAFAPSKLITAAVAVVLSFLLIFGYNRLIGLVFSAGDAAIDVLVKSFLSIIPFALIFFLYIMAAAIIARITMDALEPVPDTHATLSMISRSIVPVFIANVILFLAADAVLILFGMIPVIGPVLFALTFLPVYGISLCIIILIAIGFWFYPPVIAGSPPGAMSPIRGLSRFIRKQNFRLAYTIPLMTMITAVTFAAIYMLHYCSFSLSLLMAKNILAEEGDKIFSAIPATLLQLSGIMIIGTDSGLFKSLMNGLLWSHNAGGIIIGIVISLISIFLLALFISITATLSTRLYIMMEKGTDMDDASKIRLLLFLVLMLTGMFLVKKIFF